MTKTNVKGQVVIPKEYRQLLGIKKGVALNIIATGSGIFIQPVRAVTGAFERADSYLDLLRKTKGAWAGDSWAGTARKRAAKEKAAARKHRQAAW